mmetsp:Transcript_23477/g.54781  ORF Transcript_23477/g.54781 Transcript_23477/m.54781 type:complete len:379 (-) Transcript_23477:42-1178(-)
MARKPVRWQQLLPRAGLGAVVLGAIFHVRLDCASEAFDLPHKSRRTPQQLDDCLTSRRKVIMQPLQAAAAAATLAGASVPAHAETRVEWQSPGDEKMFRTQRPSPEIPKVLAVQLLRTTYETIEAWGTYPSMAVYQKNFGLQIREGFQSFRARYQNYDLSALFGGSDLMASGGGVTNRFYFSFLNEAQWRVIGRQIRSSRGRLGFSRLLGERLYRKILTGEVLRNEVAEDMTNDLPQEVRDQLFIGNWPKLNSTLPKTSSLADLKDGASQLLGYLQTVGYLKDFRISDFQKRGDGVITFVSYVDDPVNLEATKSLFRSNDDFAPRYDQRILEAYFSECGFDPDLRDELAESFEAKGPTSSTSILSGIRTQWELSPSES